MSRRRSSRSVPRPSSSTKSQGKPRWYRPSLEPLEDRTLLSLDLTAFAQHFHDELGTLQTTISTALDGASQIPFLNKKLGDDGSSNAFTANLLSNLQTAIAGVTDVSQLQLAIFNVIGPSGTGPHALGDTNLDGTVDQNDVIVTGDNSGFEVEMRLHQGVTNATTAFNLNLGLPGIPFKVTSQGSVNVQINFDYELAVKFNPNNSDPFSVDASKVLMDTMHQMSLTVTASLPTMPQPFSATVIVGFLEGTVKDHMGMTNMNVSFNLDGLDPASMQAPTVGLSGLAKLDLDLAGGFVDGGGMISDKFPSINTEFKLNWQFDTGTQTSADLPTVEFGNVTVDMGTFLSAALDPILKDIQVVTQPLEPLIHILKTPIPGLSDLSEKLGGGPITLESLAKIAADVAPGSPYSAIITIVADLVDIIDTINGINLSNGQVGINLGNFSLGGPNDSAVQQDLRALTAAGDPTGGLGDLTSLQVNLATLASSVDQQLTNFANNNPGPLGDAANAAKGALDQLTATDGIQMSFPIFQDPEHSAFLLLLGRDVDFVRFAAHFHFDAEEDLSFPLFGLDVGFGGQVHVDAALTLAYDTFGVREFLNDPNKKGTDFLDGLYIDNSTDPMTGLPATHFSISGEIHVSVGVGFVIFSLDAEGGIGTGNFGNTPITVSLHDPDTDGQGVDHKLRASELAFDLTQNLGCIFDTSGELDAFLKIVLKVGVDIPFVGFVGYEHDFDIAEVKLIDFSNSMCNPMATPPPPVLGAVDANGTLTLFMGPNAHLRQNVDNTDIDEEFEVTHTGGSLGNESVMITAFGYVTDPMTGARMLKFAGKQTKNLTGIKKIFADGGAGNNVILIDKKVLSDAELHAGGGSSNNEVVTYLGSGTATLFGGPGNDRLTTGPDSHNDVLYGGNAPGVFPPNGTADGNDVLIAGGNGDVAYGQGGPNDVDQLQAGAGNNISLFGGEGNDQFGAGTGTSAMYGLGGNDVFTWQAGDGATTVDGGTGFNALEVDGSPNGDTVGVSADPTDHHLVVNFNGVTIAGTSIQELSLEGGGGADNVTFNDLSQTALQAVAVNLGREGASSDGVLQTYTINGPNGPQAITINEQNITGMVSQNQNGMIVTQTVTGTVEQVAGLGPTFFVANPEDKLIINPAAGNDTVVVNTNKVKGTTIIDGNDSTDVYNVLGTGGPTTINTGAGANTVNIGSMAPALGGVLSGILADVTVKSGTGPVILNVDDSGDSTGRTGTLTANKISGLGMTGNINYDPITALNITLGSGGDNFSITGVAPNTVTTVNGGSGIDTLDANFAADFTGTLHIIDFETITIEVGTNFNGIFTAANPGNIQSVTIGGALTSTGQLIGDSIGTMTVGTDLAGEVLMNNSINSLSIGGSVTATGFVSAGGDLTTLSVGKDIAGAVIAGGNMNSATIGGTVSGLLQAGGNINMLFVGGDVSGTTSFGGNVGTAHVVGSVSGLFFAGGNATLIMVDKDISGTLQVLGTISTLQLGGSVTDPGKVRAGNIVLMTVGGNLAGDVNVTNKLTTLIVQGNTSGTIEAGDIDTIAVYGGIGPIVARITEGGVTRRIEAALPSNPYPLPKTVEATNSIGFAYFYDSRDAASITDPVLGIRVSNPNAVRFDLSLVTYSDTAKFELARLDTASSTTPADIRNVAVEGDILTSVTSAIAGFFGYAASTPGGVRLPADNLAAVATRNNVHSGYVQAASLEAVAFGSLTESATLTVLGVNAKQGDAATLPAAGTLVKQANDTFRVPVSDSPNVALFIDDTTNKVFDSKSIVFADQVANDARGAVTALVQVTVVGTVSNVQRVDFTGDGGSFSTQQPILTAITSTGPLGDVTLKGSNGMPNVTAPSVIGNLTAANGPIFGTVQTTGLRTDPITHVLSAVSADLGRAFKDATGKITGVTTVTASGGITGRLISRGNLVSKVTSKSVSGLIAVQGDIGVIQTDAQGNAVLNSLNQLIRFGGISVTGSGSGFGGQLVALGDVFGDITVSGGLTGRMAVKGRPVQGLASTRTGFLGNVSFSGAIASTGAIVTAGMIGDKAGGTGLSIGSLQGIIGAEGQINLVKGKSTGAAFYGQNLAGTPSGAAIDAIFTNGGLPLAFDLVPGSLDLGGLALILTDLSALTVSNGTLTGPIP